MRNKKITKRSKNLHNDAFFDSKELAARAYSICEVIYDVNKNSHPAHN